MSMISRLGITTLLSGVLVGHPYLARGKDELGAAATPLSQYVQAIEYYKAQKYTQASELLAAVIPRLAGQAESIQATFYRAYSLFYQKDYEQSADVFQHFYTNYPNALETEEAMYMHGRALYMTLRDVRLDQVHTQATIQVFEDYLGLHPAGAYVNEATQYLAALHTQLALKAFQSVKLYHKLTHYRAAVVTCSNLQQDFSSNVYSEPAAYIKADAQYRLAKSSPVAEQQDALKTTLRYCQDFLDQYPHSAYTRAVEKIYKKTIGLIKAN
ncbi:MAG: outer membrane protein assembly factor BamD [Bacteroidota bacterium]